jgi:predicted TPR repeat methyltransferase
MMKQVDQSRFDADYFEHGRQLGLSCYENYRWIPSLTIPMASALVKQLGILKTDTILDFGCAKGFVVKAFRMLGYECSGCDVSEYAIDNADALTRPHLRMIRDGRVPMSNAGKAWDWIVAKDVLEHLTHDQIDYALSEFAAGACNVFAVVPLGDGEKFVIPEMEKDVTHVTRESLQWWEERFRKHGFDRVAARYEMRGIKQRWVDDYPLGNGFIVAKS